MESSESTLEILPCLDSDAMAAQRKQELDIPRSRAAALGASAFDVMMRGYYLNARGEQVDWSRLVESARTGKRSFPPDAALPPAAPAGNRVTRVQVCNETTLRAAADLKARGHRPLALNFANGVTPGGGFLGGARAQEETLCRSSALYATLVDDPMYAFHGKRSLPDSSDWVIYSPDVPVFRDEYGGELDEPWLLSFLTSAAPYAPTVGQPLSGDLLERRIRRVLEVSAAMGYQSLVLGAWGCGAFSNDPVRTARDFRSALERDFRGCFADVVFAITDWSPERRLLGVFRDTLAN
jgi:uncharacterized protein (TIGR02452 family)